MTSVFLWEHEIFQALHGTTLFPGQSSIMHQAKCIGIHPEDFEAETMVD